MKPLRFALLLGVLLSAAGCARLPARPELPVTETLAQATETDLDRAIAPAEALREGRSGFRLLDDGPEAFALRAHSAAMAGRSIDVQTYIWHGDLTGRVLAWRLLQAADRGVRVRLLVDDMDARSKSAGFAALHAHENIAVRTFNPYATRSGMVRFLAESFTSFRRINHRMHNKSWIVDNRLAIVGGRNLGDEYFGAADSVNFVDLEFAMVGPVVRDVSSSFDRYWNSEASWPIDALDPDAVSAEALAALRRALRESVAEVTRSAYAEALRQDDRIARMASGDWPMEWVADYHFVADDPLKSSLDADPLQRSAVIQALLPVMQGARDRLHVVSPYFVPGEGGTELFTGRVSEGAEVAILTNSLAANDVAAVHGGYARSRKALLAGGVELWELKPAGGEAGRSSLLGSSGASLHTKALLADGETLFVGSYNLDPRSTSLNSEQGVLVMSEPLARQFEAIFDRQVSPRRAWRVTLDDGRLHWSDDSGAVDREPRASTWRRFQAWLARTLRLDAQL